LLSVIPVIPFSINNQKGDLCLCSLGPLFKLEINKQGLGSSILGDQLVFQIGEQPWQPFRVLSCNLATATKATVSNLWNKMRDFSSRTARSVIDARILPDEEV